MSVVSLYNNNKNQYRKYPLKQGSSCIAVTGQTVPDSFFANCSISTTYGSHRIHISQIFISNSIVNITIASTLENSKVLGKFYGTVTEDFTTLNLISADNFTSGSLTIGSLKDMDATDVALVFKPEALEFEESVIFCYTAPNVSSVAAKDGRRLTGFVRFGELTNVLKSTLTDHVNNIKRTVLSAEYPDDVINLADKSTYLDNCPNPAIYSINTVTPSYVGDSGENSKNDGNIYFVGINPIKFYGTPTSQVGSTGSDSEKGVLGVSAEGVTLERLCTARHKIIPPTDVSGFTVTEFIDKYYSKPALVEPETLDYPYPVPSRLAGNLNSTKKAEHYYWPQFVRQEYYSLWPSPTGLVQVIIDQKIKITEPLFHQFEYITNLESTVTSTSELQYAPNWLSVLCVLGPLGGQTSKLWTHPEIPAPQASSLLHVRYTASSSTTTYIYRVAVDYIALPNITYPLTNTYNQSTPLRFTPGVSYTSDSPLLSVVAANMTRLSSNFPDDVYIYSLTSGSSLPPGLSLNTTSGKITGTVPANFTSAAQYTVSIDAINPAGETQNPVQIILQKAP